MWASVAMHLGALHAGEAYALIALALAPFVVLAVVIAAVSRRDRLAAERTAKRTAANPDERPGV